MRLNFIRSTEPDVQTAAVRLPAWNSRGEVFVRVSDAAVMFFFVFVLHRVGSRIPAQPELLDELLALVVGPEALERGPFLVRDDPRDILLQPAVPRGLQFSLERRLFLHPLLFGERPR